MSRLTNLGRALGLALLALPVLASSAYAQDDCRGWTRSCASVEVRAEGDNLILFVPNAVAEVRDDEAAEGAENVTIVPQPLDAEPFDVPPGTTVYASTDSDDPGNISCDDDESHYAGSRGLDEDDERRCSRPVGALFLLAVPATVAILAPGNGDDPTVERPLPQSGSPDADDEGDDSSDDGSGAGGDRDGNGAGPGDDGSSTGGSDGGNSAGQGSGGNSGGSGTGTGSGGSGQTGGDDDPADGGSTGSTGGSTGGNSAGTSDGTGGTGGTGGGGTGGSGGTGDDYGPYHPGAGDLPPISQVPEPVSTTLFTLGLAGYAGARLRRRRLEGEIEEDC